MTALATRDRPTRPPYRLERWDAATATARLDEVMAVYRAAFLDVHEADPQRATADRKAHAYRHLMERTFLLVAALDGDDQLVGMGYGHRGNPGQWWHDVVRAAVVRAAVVRAGSEDGIGEAAARRWLDDCFEIVELHVLPDHQGRGLGRALLSELVAGRPESTVALSALDDPASRTGVARRLYDSVGFRPLLEEFRFPGVAVPYTVLARSLPLEGDPRPSRAAAS